MPYRVLIEGGRTRNMYPTILSYGGGADSTALAIGLHQRDEIPDSIVFAAVGDFRSFPEGDDIRALPASASNTATRFRKPTRRW